MSVKTTPLLLASEHDMVTVKSFVHRSQEG